jgi:Fur family ferric uptake transcriptional regulator
VNVTEQTDRSDHEVARLHDRLSEYMERNRLRSTSQRRLVCDVFFRVGGHLSIDEVLERVRAKDAKVGYATVYRTLRLLVDSGLASPRQFGDSVTRFEIAHADGHHDHLICVKCGKIVEFEDDRIEEYQHVLAQRHGFELVSHKHELYGRCDDCR